MDVKAIDKRATVVAWDVSPNIERVDYGDILYDVDVVHLRVAFLASEE